MSTKCSFKVWPESKLGCQPPNTMGNSGRRRRTIEEISIASRIIGPVNKETPKQRQSAMLSETMRRLSRQRAPSMMHGSYPLARRAPARLRSPNGGPNVFPEYGGRKRTTLRDRSVCITYPQNRDKLFRAPGKQQT